MEKLYIEAKDAQARGDQTAAVAKYQEILKIAPTLAAAYNNLGLLYINQQQYQQAVDILAKGLKLNSKMPSASALLGISLYQMGKYPEARTALEAALKANPADNNAELLLVKDLIKLKKLEAASVHLHQLAKHQPENQEVWYLLGRVYMQLSEQALTRMNAIDPNSVLVHEMSGEMMADMKNYDGALVEYKKAAELAPQRPGIHYKLGSVYLDLSQWEAAMEQFRAELVNDPSNCQAQAQIANILIAQEMKPAEGLTEIDKALAICPELTQARVDRGRALINLNRSAEAVKDLQVAERASPDDPSTHFFLAQAYRATGEGSKAQVEMQIFSKLEETARQATAARAREVIKTKEGVH